MYKKIIKNYLEKMTINDILNYAQKENISISIKDANTLFYHAKKYYQDFFDGNDLTILKKIKEEIDLETYKILYKKYLEAKIKYLN